MSKQFAPNLFILGAAKSGTTTLYNYLVQIPDVCLSHPKEPVFFEKEYQRGLDYYRDRYFLHWKGERFVGDARHRHLYLPYVPQRIYETNPRAKLIVILRDPVWRAYSHWWWWYQRGTYEKSPFDIAIYQDYERIQRGEFINTTEMIEKYCESLDDSGFGLHRTYLDTGHYAEQLERYLTHFSFEQLKVVFMEDMEEKPLSFLKNLEDFIGTSFFNSGTFAKITTNQALQKAETRLPLFDRFSNLNKKINAISLIPSSLLEMSRKVRYRLVTRPPMAVDIYDWLRHYYRPHNRLLEKLLNIDLSHWD